MYNGHLMDSPVISHANCGDISDDREELTSSKTSDGSGSSGRCYDSRGFLASSIQTVNFDSLTEIVIDDLAETEPTSAILDYCKRKFLRPYVNMLGVIGLHPMMSDMSLCRACLSHLVTSLMIALISSGYFMQYYTSFRRDRGFYSNSSAEFDLILSAPYHRDSHDFGELFFAYIVPSSLHFLGFLLAVFVIRAADNEQLQNLVERVFLMSNSPRRLCVTLWLFVLGGFMFLILLLSCMVLSVTPQPHVVTAGRFSQFDHKVRLPAKIFLILTLFFHDLIQIAVLTTFCLQCYLLRLHLCNLKEKLLQHTIDTIDWMREVLEFRKLLNHLNKKIALPVCFFTVMNLSYAFAGLVYLFEEYELNCSLKTLSLNSANFVMWLTIGLMPFFLAASVTRTCKSTQASGHHIRVRPFVYHNTAQQDLDSTLLFVSSLNMSAKLFRMPIQGNYLCCAILIVSVVVITLGMCLNFSLGNIN